MSACVKGSAWPLAMGARGLVGGAIDICLILIFFQHIYQSDSIVHDSIQNHASGHGCAGVRRGFGVFVERSVEDK